MPNSNKNSNNNGGGGVVGSFLHNKNATAATETDSLLLPRTMIMTNDNENTTNNGAAAAAATNPTISNNRWKLYCAVTFVVVLTAVLCFDFLEQRAQQQSPSSSLHQGAEPSETNQSAAHEWWEEQDHDVPTTTTVLVSGDDELWKGGGADASSQLRWGILGLGRIARDFTTALKMTGANVTAVAAGSLPESHKRARAFAQTFHIANHYGSYEELAADRNVDIVYIATTNNLHYNNTLLMLQAGKNVLVEKPMAVTYQQAQIMAATAVQHKRLLLTNYWTRFFPVYQNYYTRSRLESSIIRSTAMMHGDFGFQAHPDAADRFLNRTLGGGVMLDLGCYLVNLAVMVVAAAANNNSNNNNNASTSSLYPVDIQATGQTSINSVDYLVDTEVSFALRWGGPPPPSTANCEDDGLERGSASSMVESHHHQQQRTSEKGSSFSMIMSGQASFRRPSSFEVEINGGQTRLVIHKPANAPTDATLYEYETYGPLKHVEKVHASLPEYNTAYYYPEQYPHGAGFVYVINALETCMKEKGIPGRRRRRTAEKRHGGSGGGGCLELEELTMKEQLATAAIVDDIMQKTGYWSLI